MKLSVSNIGWTKEQDVQVYGLMKKYGYSGLEIAPTRIFPQAPYDKLMQVKDWSAKLKEDYGFAVSSVQSLWYGRQEKLFGTPEERRILINYTKKAIDFAAAAGCKNLVFGCPKNRILPEGVNPQIAVSFFRELGDYAALHGTVIGMEANPPACYTNYINGTHAAAELIRTVNSRGFKLNLDTGTMIENGETVSELSTSAKLIHHVHISEPGLAPLRERTLHQELRQLLLDVNYRGYVSVEMGRTDNLKILESRMEYVRSIFA